MSSVILSPNEIAFVDFSTSFCFSCIVIIGYCCAFNSIGLFNLTKLFKMKSQSLSKVFTFISTNLLSNIIANSLKVFFLIFSEKWAVYPSSLIKLKPL